MTVYKMLGTFVVSNHKQKYTLSLYFTQLQKGDMKMCTHHFILLSFIPLFIFTIRRIKLNIILSFLKNCIYTCKTNNIISNLKTGQ